MSLRSLGLFLFCLQMTGIQCIFLVSPEDVVANVGNSVSFNCSTDVSSSARRGIRWIYTTERNFRRPSHIYANGRIFLQWRMRLNVTESSEGLFTLTISTVNVSDIGFYTCMDLSDDSKATAELALYNNYREKSDIHSTNISTDVTRKGLKHSEQENDQTPERTGRDKFGGGFTNSDISGIELYKLTSTLFVFSALIVALVLIAIVLCLRNSRRRKDSIVDAIKQSSEENSCEKSSPFEQQTLEDFDYYEVIPDQDMKEESPNMSGSRPTYNQCYYNNAMTESNDQAVVYAPLTKKETVEQSPVYASLNFNTGQNQSKRHPFTRCFQKS